MITQYHKLALTVSLVLAMVFIFSCSSDDGDGKDALNSDSGGEKISSPGGNDGSSSSGGNGGSSSSGGGSSSPGGNGSSPSGGNTQIRCPNAEIGDNSLTCGGQTYRTVIIGSQIWMAENLNHVVKDSVIDYCSNVIQKCFYKTIDKAKCLEDKPANCTRFGRLYDWDTALDVCPEGWHLPSDADWNVLMKFVNPSCSDNSDCNKAGTKLKATRIWDTYRSSQEKGIPIGEDFYGFTALPSTSETSNNNTYYRMGYWWSSSEGGAYRSAYGRQMYAYEEQVRYYNNAKTTLQSVRCLKNGSFTPSSSSSEYFTDTRDNKEYKYVKIGNQTWMAEDLTYLTNEQQTSHCPGNNEDNCKTYGRLYNWTNALEACPAGWHLPNNDEWDELIDLAGGAETAGKHLKATSGWRWYDNDLGGLNLKGQDTYGFSALPMSGEGIEWWSASASEYISGRSYPYSYGMDYLSNEVRGGYCEYCLRLSDKNVRCIQDSP